MKNIINVWDKQWRIEIISIYHKIIKWKKKIFLKCKCQCWVIKEIWKWNFILGQKSCWCLRNELAGDRNRTHWLSKDRKFTDSFYSAKKRTLWEYKKRWIKFKLNCFDEFVKNMYESYLYHCEKYWKNNTSLDRINNDWDYEYWNIRWATREIQNNNQSKRKDQKKFVINYEWKEYFFYNKSDCWRKFNLNLTTLTDWLNHWNKPRNKKIYYIRYV